MVAKPNETARARWAEIAVSVGLSILTSAIVVAWTVSATLAKFETTLQSQEKRIGVVEQQGVQGIAQSSRVAVLEAQWGEVVRRLENIDRKLESR